MHDPRAPIETHVLRLAIDKALAELPWQPRLTAHDAIRRTAAWFKAFATSPAQARPLCEADIAAFEQAVSGRLLSSTIQTSM
jgi:dTDP-D-glucose 4,6-dehydratase